MRIDGRNKIERVKRVQKTQKVKDSTYYTERNLTKEDQTGEIFANNTPDVKRTNMTAQEAYEKENAIKNASSIYNKLQKQKTEKEKVEEFKSGYKSKVTENSVKTENENKEEQKETER